MATILHVLDAWACAHLHQALASFASGLEGSWGSSQSVEQVSQAERTRYPRAVVQALALGWPLPRQARHSTPSGIRKRLAQDAACSCASAAPVVPAAGAVLHKAMVEALETAGRSASRIEPVHSALRPLLATCRGQVDPPLLDLFASVHTPRGFGRGKRAGKAPIDILTGHEMDQPWLPSLCAML